MRLLAALLLAPSALAAQLPDSAVRVARWREDLRVLATELPRRHRHAFARTTRREFEGAVAALDSAIPALDDGQLRMRFLRLAAMLRDGHTSVALPRPAMRLPVAIYWFDEGPRVIAATPEHQDLVGHRLVALGERPIAEVLDTLARFLPHENDMAFREVAAQALVLPSLLRDAGLAGDSSLVVASLEGPEGTRTVTLGAVPLATEFRPVHGEAPTPLYRQRSREKYWFAWIPERSTIFVKYNQCRDSTAFRAMTDSIFRLADSAGATRIVVDLRHNAGGDSRVVRPLVEGIRSRRALNRRDALFVVIGRQTFSSGFLAALAFRRNTNATLLGEPVGARPNNYGEVKRFTLPNSALEVSYSTKYFRTVDGDPAYFEPDVRVPLTMDAALAGRDPALDWIFSRRP